MDNQQYQPAWIRPNLLDVPISIFANRFAREPEGVTTLRRIVSREINRAPIEAIRAEEDEVKQKNLKDSLRAFAPVALLHHRKADTPFSEKIDYQWPILMGDIDRKDNPGLNMAELKYHLCRLPYLLLCAYSVRGGLWFVVRLPDNQTPETLAAHFRYLQKVFAEKFGVKLDSSKGGNPTDLRFVSYDAAPYFNEAATVLSGRYTPPQPRPQPRQQRYAPDESVLLTRLVRFAESATDGNRHDNLLKAATAAGGYVAAGRIDEQTAVYALETVASEWPTFTKSQKTIRDGIRYGLAKPLYADEPRNDQRPKPHTTVKQDQPPRSSSVEILAVEPCDTYPAEWDDYTDCVPTLTLSPNRDTFARLLGVAPDQLRLYRLKPHQAFSQ